MTRFREALLDELTRRVADRAAQPAPVRRPRILGRRYRWGLAGGALAAITAAAALFTTQGSATPAYAVTANPDGTVTVTFNRIADPAGVNQALRDAGVRAMVLLPTPADACPVEDRGTTVVSSLREAVQIHDALVSTGDEVNVARLRPDQIRAGTVLVFMPSGRGPRGEAGMYLHATLYAEPGPKCVVEDWVPPVNPRRTVPVEPSPTVPAEPGPSPSN